MDAFGEKVEAKPLENDFYLNSGSEAYDIFDNGTLSGYSHVGTVYVHESNREGVEKEGSVEPDSFYVERALDGMEEPDLHNYLERIEEQVNQEIGLEYPADIGLVEAVEEAGL